MACSGSNTLESTPTSLLQACKEGNVGLVREHLSSPSCDLLACDEDSNTALHLAAEQGHMALVQELAGWYPTSSACRNTKGRTPLHLASAKGHSVVVETLAQRFPGDLEARDKNGDTPLHLAALFGHMETVDLLCQQFHCDPRVKGHDDCTLLHYACAGGHLDIVRRLLLQHQVDPLIQDVRGDTPLHYAASDGHSDVIITLFSEFNCSPHVRSTNTLLHQAAGGGHWQLVHMLIEEYGLDPSHQDDTGMTAIHWAIGSYDTLDCVRETIYKPGGSQLNMVEKLVSEYGCDVKARDNKGLTPLHVAALSGKEEVVRELIAKYKCPVDCLDSSGNTPLHWAAMNGHLVVVEKLVSEYGCDVNARDNDGLTPLHVAALCGEKEVVRELITKYKCPMDCVDYNGSTPLHMAAIGGHAGVVRMLMSEFGADATTRNQNGDSVLNLAALNEHAEVYLVVLVSEFGCSPSVKGFNGWTPLHHACSNGHSAVVMKLVLRYGCDVNARDNDGLTPLHVAALCGKEEVVRELITKYKCPVNCVDFDGDTPLHKAAINGHAGVVRMLLSEYGADAAACNNNGDTMLSLAALKGHVEVYLVVSLLKFGCSPSRKGQYGRTPLHHACSGGHLVVVQKLVSEYGCDLNARDNDGLTPLQVAALCGKEEVVRELITKYKCPVDCVDSNGNTPLHHAAVSGCAGVVRMLVSEYECDVNARDSDGHTPLYFGIRSHHLSIVAELVRHNSDLTFVDAAHKKLIKSANKISKNARTRVFVVGYPEVGKSTLIEAIKSETFFTRNVKQVPAHTAGIVPVFHESSNYGWVVFYDFAGDEEYYSSHAAILEKIMGNSADIFVLVFDLSKLSVEGMRTAHSIYYWLRFLSYVSSSRVQVLLIGSHADVLQREGKNAEQTLSEIFTDVSQSFYSEFPDTSVEMFGYVALNCCITKSQGLQKIKAQLKQVQKSLLSNVPQLTAGASILLGTLERDFQGKVACQVKDLINHIETREIYLPREAEQLHSNLAELHSYGLVLLLECSSPQEDEWVVLDLPLFLSTVHKKLFSSFHQHEDSLSNLGIIPTARLQTIFPEFSLALLQGCLTLLQYCQEIDDPQIISKVLGIPEVETGLTQSFLFFPALLQTNRENVKWIRSYDSSLCYIGWFIECYRTYDFFPPRFLHVLLLRLAFTFALPKVPSELDDEAAVLDVYSRKCTLWKNGIHWLMESGIEVVVEVVKQKRAVLVMVRGSSDQEVECGDILAKVAVKVVEAKSEFCNILKANLYIVIPNDPKQSTLLEMDQLQLFEARNVREVLLKGSEGAVSRDGKGFLPSSDLICLQSQTIWNLLFPMGIKQLTHRLEDIVGEWYRLGVELGLPTSKLSEIRLNNPGDVLMCKTLMLLEWERRPTLKPSWSSLVDALHKMDKNTAADRISQQFNVDLQRRLLDPSLASCELDDDTLQQLAHATGDKWVSIASLLSFTAAEVEQMRSEDQPALAMLHKLKEKGTLTHEQLCHRLQMIPLLNPTI